MIRPSRFFSKIKKFTSVFWRNTDWTCMLRNGSMVLPGPLATGRKSFPITLCICVIMHTCQCLLVSSFQPLHALLKFLFIGTTFTEKPRTTSEVFSLVERSSALTCMQCSLDLAVCGFLPSAQCRGTTWNPSFRIMCLYWGTHISRHSTANGWWCWSLLTSCASNLMLLSIPNQAAAWESSTR